MKIAYLVPTYPMPSQTFIRREIAALEAQGLTIERFAMRRFLREQTDPAERSEQEQTHYILDAGIVGLAWAVAAEAVSRPKRWIVAARAAVELGLRSERGLSRNLAFLGEACYLRRRLGDSGARHLHAHFGTNSAAVAMLCRLLGGPPYSITIHGPEEFDAPQPLSLSKKIHHADFVIAISQFTRSQLYRWCILEDWRKIHVIHCGLDELFLSSTPVPIPERPRLINVGRLSEQKGQLLLVEAAARLRDRGIDFELVIVGDGPMRPELERRIDRLDLKEHVRITGFLSNFRVYQELLASRVLVLPSFAEGLPVAIMESLALCRPVITTYVAGIPELVESEVHGWLVPPGAIEPLVDAMAAAVTAVPAEIERMGRAGAARVAERHNISIETRKLADLFSDGVAIAGQPARRTPLANTMSTDVDRESAAIRH